MPEVSGFIQMGQAHRPCSTYNNEAERHDSEHFSAMRMSFQVQIYINYWNEDMYANRKEHILEKMSVSTGVMFWLTSLHNLFLFDAYSFRHKKYSYNKSQIWPGTVAHACYSSTREAEVGRWRGQEIETTRATMVKPRLY